jgi:hypothetical protein
MKASLLNKEGIDTKAQKQFIPIISSSHTSFTTQICFLTITIDRYHGRDSRGKHWVGLRAHFSFMGFHDDRRIRSVIPQGWQACIKACIGVFSRCEDDLRFVHGNL